MLETITKSRRIETREAFLRAWNASSSIESRLGLLHGLAESHFIDYGPETISDEERVEFFLRVSEQCTKRLESDSDKRESLLVDFSLLFLTKHDNILGYKEPDGEIFKYKRFFTVLDKYLRITHGKFTKDPYRSAVENLLVRYWGDVINFRQSPIPFFWYLIATKTGNFEILHESVYEKRILGFISREVYTAIAKTHGGYLKDKQAKNSVIQSCLSNFLQGHSGDYYKRLTSAFLERSLRSGYLEKMFGRS